MPCCRWRCLLLYARYLCRDQLYAPVNNSWPVQWALIVAGGKWGGFSVRRAIVCTWYVGEKPSTVSDMVKTRWRQVKIQTVALLTSPVFTQIPDSVEKPYDDQTISPTYRRHLKADEHAFEAFGNRSIYLSQSHGACLRSKKMGLSEASSLRSIMYIGSIFEVSTIEYNCYCY